MITVSSRRPVIGISAYEEHAHWNLWDATAAILPATYVRSVQGAGAVAVMIPVQALTEEEADDLLGRLGGLILSGGPDVDPGRYGADPHPSTDSPRCVRDDMEALLATRATAHGLPTLAICRGFQLLNVARGGTLHQHLPELLGHEAHSPSPGSFGEHRVRVAPTSQLGAVLQWESASVPTHHHQGVSELGDGLVASAWAEDGTIEAFEDPKVPFLLGVQWHPEAGDDPSLFHGLVEAAAMTASARASR